MKKCTAVLVALVALSGCAGAPPDEPAPISAPRAEAVTPTPAPAPDPALARADALLADLQSKEAEYKKLERDLPKAQAPAVFLEPPLPATAAPARATQTTAAPAAAPPASAAPAAASGQDEAWWKERARTLTTKLEEAQQLAAAAAVAVESATLRITQDQARAQYLSHLAAVNNAKADLERLREDGRRANVPAGWLRWP